VSEQDSTTLGRPRHVAIIMDGNGRWATSRGWPRLVGHRRGVEAVRRVVEAASGFGIDTLSLYAFSADNWRRPHAEVRGLFALFDEYLRTQAEDCAARGIRLTLIGRRDRLPAALSARAESVERATAKGRALEVRLAIDYSARDAIWAAAERMIRAGRGTREEFVARLHSGCGEPADVADVDLLIRSGSEQRLSDFLLWECAYAELWLTDVAWPDFTREHLEEAIAAFARRDRRFGGLAQPAQAGVSQPVSG
jgi:undecaprenyl diphosphate synthase